MNAARTPSVPPTVVVAMDSLKGSLDARQACAAVARGLRRARPDWRVVECPMADGGEGTAGIVRDATGMRWIDVRATGPLPASQVMAGYLCTDFSNSPDTRGAPAAFVEMASVNGLTLLAPSARDPLGTSTRGTGELIAHAVRHGARTVQVAIGGSATVDGGTGAARALGWRFLDADGDEVPEGGGHLGRIARIVPPDSDPLAGVRIEVLCDVDHPLLGDGGAARVFGPQKGADPAGVERLEHGLAVLADRISGDLGIDVRDVPGAGAAGGLGAGALAFFGARLVSGVGTVMDAVGLDAALAGAALVVTGEGQLDASSLHGKVVAGVLARAGRAGVPIAVVAGRVTLDPARADAAGIVRVERATPPDLSEAEAFAQASDLLAAAATRLAEGTDLTQG